MADQDYPESCLRGIRISKWVEEVGSTKVVLGPAFEPNHNPRPHELRSDGYIDASINWEDEPEAINNLKRNNNAQFGIARLPRVAIDELIEINRKRSPDMEHCLSYERARIEGNDYHGNLLYLRTIAKPVLNMWAGILANYAEIIPG